jgi:hypothetical protein
VSQFVPKKSTDSTRTSYVDSLHYLSHPALNATDVNQAVHPFGVGKLVRFGWGLESFRAATGTTVVGCRGGLPSMSAPLSSAVLTCSLPTVLSGVGLSVSVAI